MTLAIFRHVLLTYLALIAAVFVVVLVRLWWWNREDRRSFERRAAEMDAESDRKVQEMRKEG